MIKIKTIIILTVGLLAMVGGCAHRPPAQVSEPKEIIFTIESDIPNITLTIYPKKDCENNWNFCAYQ